MQYNVVGDLAGNYLTMRALLAQMGEGITISVGDMIDRGPRSKEVVEYFLNGPHWGICGNHELFCIDYYLQGMQYGKSWLRYGGEETRKSFGGQVPMDVVRWMGELPKYRELELDGRRIFISHAFCSDWINFNPEGEHFCWSNNPPIKTNKYDLQICGHNSHMGLHWFEDYAVCLDSSRQQILTGLRLPDGKIFQQEHID